MGRNRGTIHDRNGQTSELPAWIMAVPSYQVETNRFSLLEHGAGNDPEVNGTGRAVLRDNLSIQRQSQMKPSCLRLRCLCYTDEHRTAREMSRKGEAMK